MSSDDFNTDGIPRVHYTNKRLSFTKPTHGHSSTGDDVDDGWVIVQDMTGVKPSSPKHNLSQEEARLLHQVQATNAELQRVKHIKRKKLYGPSAELVQSNRAEDQLLLQEDAKARRLIIQKAARASYRRKNQNKLRQKPANQKASNRNYRAKGNIRQPKQRRYRSGSQ
jgi:hypothetical protein